MIYCQLKAPSHLLLIYKIGEDEHSLRMNTNEGLLGAPFVGILNEDYETFKPVIEKVLTEDQAKEFMKRAMKAQEGYRQTADELDQFLGTCGRKD